MSRIRCSMQCAIWYMVRGTHRPRRRLSSDIEVSRTGSKQAPDLMSHLLALWNYVHTHFVISLRGVFAEALRRCAETAIVHRKRSNKYCGDLRRRRIRAKTAQKISKSWLVKFPSRPCRNRPTILYHTILYYAIIWYNIVYHTILYYTILCCYITLHYITLHYIILIVLHDIILC